MFFWLQCLAVRSEKRHAYNNVISSTNAILVTLLQLALKWLLASYAQ
uniref:Uncharacterized protein n=1 Tax=Arundo donax TaxID=35708 RepID=A0A0A9HLZ4_ARUDO